MVELGYNKSLVTPVAPNKDAVHNRIPSGGGMNEFAQFLGKAATVLDKVNYDHSLAQASKEYSDHMMHNALEFNKLQNQFTTQNLDDPEKVMSEYVQKFKDHQSEFLSNISNREIRRHYRQQLDHDLIQTRKEGMRLIIGAKELQIIENTKKTLGNIHGALALDPSNETYDKLHQIALKTINNASFSIEKKQKLITASMSEIQLDSARLRGHPGINRLRNINWGPSKTPKDPLSIKEQIDNSSDPDVEAVEDYATIKIGLKGYDDASLESKMKFMNKLAVTIKEEAAADRQKINPLFARLEAELDEGKVPVDMNLLSYHKLERAYGYEKAQSVWENLQYKEQMTPLTAAVPSMTTGEFKEFNEEQALSKMDDYQRNKALALILKLEKRHENSMKALHEDPVSWGIKYGLVDPLRFDDPKTFAEALAKRSTFAKNVAEKHGVPPPFMNSEEEKELDIKRKGSSSTEFAGFIKSAYDASNEADRDVTRDIKYKKRSSIRCG